MTTHVFTAAPGVRLAHATAIGIPLRPVITGPDRPALRDAARRRFGLRPDGPVLLVTGGSQGAQAINTAVSGPTAALRGPGCRCCTSPGHSTRSRSLTAAVGLLAVYVPLPVRGGEQRHNAERMVATGGALLVDNADLDPDWIETTLIQVLTRPGRIAAMSARASTADAPDADVVLARYVLTVVAGRRRLAS
jgi:UDP-N-acetylglucosamine--N-acetylmuramyl-(pentapeptide) pyrophosphoryl-undecaprenol N-acetylglucosamine transferase